MKIFLLILALAVIQDLQSRCVGKMFLLFSGISGLIFSIYEGRGITDVICSAGIGGAVLILSHIMNGRIGEGDGWFFVVTGLFLKMEENLALLLSGLFLCGIFGLFMAVAAITGSRNVKEIRIPFLPFLIPGGLLIALL